MSTQTLSHLYAHHFQHNIRAGMVMVNLPTLGVVTTCDCACAWNR
jgi:hypothetical protein